MSFITEIISCTKCDFSLPLHKNGIHYYYMLNDGNKINARVGLGWCNRCKSIKDIQIGVFDKKEICTCIKCSNTNIIRMDYVVDC